MTEQTPTPQAPGAPEPAAPAATTTAAPTPPSGDFKSEESKASVLADLAKERDARQALEARLDAQNKAFAEALGVTEGPKSEDLTETVRNLQKQFEASRLEATKLRIAAEKKIPTEYHDLLTETDPEKLAAQAEKVSALVTAKAEAEGAPAFQANPGQGQGGALSTPEALAEAEYAQFYPTPNRK